MQVKSRSREKERKKETRKKERKRKPNKQCKQIRVSSPPSSIQTSTTTSTTTSLHRSYRSYHILCLLRTSRALVSCMRQDRPPDRNRRRGQPPPISPSSSAISNCCISTTTRIGPTSPSGRCHPRRATSASESRLWNGHCIICAPSGTQILHRMYVVHRSFCARPVSLHSAVHTYTQYQSGLLTGR